MIVNYFHISNISSLRICPNNFCILNNSRDRQLQRETICHFMAWSCNEGEHAHCIFMGSMRSNISSLQIYTDYCISCLFLKNDVQVVIWSRWVSLESSVSLVFLLIVVWLGMLWWKWLSLFRDPKPQPFTTSGSPFVSSHLVPHDLPHLPPHFFAPYLQNSTLCSWWVGCSLLMLFLSVHFVDCSLT